MIPIQTQAPPVGTFIARTFNGKQSQLGIVIESSASVFSIRWFPQFDDFAAQEIDISRFVDVSWALDYFNNLSEYGVKYVSLS